MDVSSVKMPVANPEEEKTSSSAQESDPAFLQLLAGLGLTVQIPAEIRVPTENSGASGQAESLSADDSAATLLKTLQAADKGISLKGLSPDAQRSVEDNEASLPETSLAQEPITDQTKSKAASPAVITKLLFSVPTMPALETKSIAPSMGQEINSNDQSQPRPIDVIDVLSSSLTPKERAANSGMTPAAMTPVASAALHSPMNVEALIKQPPVSAQSITASAAGEAAGVSEPGKQHSSASSEQEAGKERIPQGEVGAGPSTGPPVTTPVASQAPVGATRAAAPEAIEAPRGPSILESPLPASVRFEVQPGDMGRIRVHLSIVDHTVYTNVTTERLDTHDLLVKSSERYEAGLAAHGLDVGRFQVDVQAQAREHPGRGSAWSHESPHRQPAEMPGHLAVERHADERTMEWNAGTVNLFA